MIQEERKDLIDRRELYQFMVDRMNKKSGGATLNSSLTLKEILEVFAELPTTEQLKAEWLKESDGWICSWCRMKSYTPFTARYCHSCGRRMEVRTFDGSKKR